MRRGRIYAARGTRAACLIVLAGFIGDVQACCPNSCNGNGECQTPFCTCKCKSGFWGGDCTQRHCPMGNAWAGYVDGLEKAHGLAECSNMGVCDRTAGTCECIFGFVGLACDRKSCPNNCNGHGTCLSAKEYALAKDPGAGATTFNSAGYYIADTVSKKWVWPGDDTKVLTYDDVWDSEMLHRCVCDKSYSGSECSLLICPHGDDPLTGTSLDPGGVQVDEVQLLNCAATGGSFSMLFRGLETTLTETATANINYNDNAATVKAKLEAIPTIRSVKVEIFTQPFNHFDATGSAAVTATNYLTNVDANAPVCGAADGGGVTTRITFDQDFGVLPLLRAHTEQLTYWGINDKRKCPHTISAAERKKYPNICAPCVDATRNQAWCDSVAHVSAYVRTKKLISGTKEHAECSGRGICDPQTSLCTCNAGFYISNGQSGKPALATDANRANCGYENPAEAQFDCPGEVGCSGHGICANSPTFKCKCSDGWLGADCSQRACPMAKAWVALPHAKGTAHANVECAGAGVCDRSKGMCQCSNGFEGTACDRLICPGTPLCSGHGQCLTQQLLAVHTTVRGDVRDYTYGERDPNSRHHWDANMMQACACDEGFYGIDCGLQECPRGDDPRVVGGTHEVQSVVCRATTGKFSLAFRQHQTADLHFQTSAADLEVELEKLVSIGDVKVEYSIVAETRTLLKKCEKVCASSDFSFNTTFGANQPTEVTNDDAFGGIGAGTCICVWDKVNATAPSVTFGGIDNDGDNYIDYTYDSLLPCTTCDATHKCTTQVPCVRLDSACSNKGDNQVLVTFLTELGDVPALYPTLNGVIDVKILTDGTARSVKGTKGNEQCSNRGTCDPQTGLCACYSGYASSDGASGQGNRGDCGHAQIEPVAPL